MAEAVLAQSEELRAEAGADHPAAPTTNLVDADGIVRWIDQAPDYMHRSKPERVMAAIRAALRSSVADRPAAGG